MLYIVLQKQTFILFYIILSASYYGIFHPKRQAASESDCDPDLKIFGQQIWIEADNTMNYHLPHFFELQHAMGGSTEITNDFRGREMLAAYITTMAKNA